LRNVKDIANQTVSCSVYSVTEETQFSGVVFPR